MLGLAAMPAKGKPLAMPLAKSMMSGTTPLKCSCAHHLPVLPTPDCTCHTLNTTQQIYCQLLQQVTVLKMHDFTS